MQYERCSSFNCSYSKRIHKLSYDIRITSPADIKSPSASGCVIGSLLIPMLYASSRSLTDLISRERQLHRISTTSVVSRFTTWCRRKYKYTERNSKASQISKHPSINYPS